MILFSITFNVENIIHEQWFSWMKNTQIPPMLLSGLISDYKLMKLLNEYDNGGTTYSCQFYMNDMTDVQKFEKEFEDELMLALSKSFPNQYVMFKTLLEVLV